MNYIFKKKSRNYDATEALQGLITSFLYINLIAHGSTHDLKCSAKLLDILVSPSRVRYR